MKKYFIIFLTIALVFVSSFNVLPASATELNMPVDDVYETVHGDGDWREIYVPEREMTMVYMIQNMLLDHQLFIINNHIAILDSSRNELFSGYVHYLYFSFGAGDGIMVIDYELFPYTIVELWQGWRLDWTIEFTHRKDESDYDEGYRQGKIDGEEVGYWKGYEDAIGEEPFGFTNVLFSIFNGFAALFAIELLPNISIGALILIPIVFGIIAFIIGRKKE